MNPGKGIIVGTINRIQLNKWLPKGVMWRRFWQLIAIFEQIKVNFNNRPLSRYPLHLKTYQIIGTIGIIGNPEKEECDPFDPTFENHQNNHCGDTGKKGRENRMSRPAEDTRSSGGFFYYLRSR